MAKEKRLGSDPLSWIMDSRESSPVKTDDSKIAVDDEKAAALPQEQTLPLESTLRAEGQMKRSVPAKDAAKENNGKPDEHRISASRSEKYLTFYLNHEEYGIEILKVEEIIGVLPITRVPRTPLFLKGVINLRGRVIPVIDLRIKFGLNAAAVTDETCIIVVQANHRTMGIIVDKVSEVVDMAENSIDDPPKFGTSIDMDYILGVGKIGDRIKLLLDIDKVLAKNQAWNSGNSLNKHFLNCVN